ncbi:MAG: hypothetical protein V3S14_16950, partial [Anaerolineae bacterium]
PRERCERIGLGYLDPATVDLAEWEGREEEGVLLVRKAGEMLYRKYSLLHNSLKRDIEHFDNSA